MSYQIVDHHPVSVAREARNRTGFSFNSPIELMELGWAFEEAVSRIHYRIQ